VEVVASLFQGRTAAVQCGLFTHKSVPVIFEPPCVYRSYPTRVSQLKIWHFLVIGIERNVCRCTFNRYSVITQFVKLADGEQLCRRCTHRRYSTSKPLKVSPEKSLILSCNTLFANERYYSLEMVWKKATLT